jgi:hypothetical protein
MEDHPGEFLLLDRDSTESQAKAPALAIEIRQMGGHA